MEELISNPLIRDENKSYGTKAQAIFDRGHMVFGWDSLEDGEIDARLCELNATPEGYAVWFIPYSNLSNTTKHRCTWSNLIIDDYIEETWMKFHSDKNFFFDSSKRVTFVKKGDEYVFMGIYEFSYKKTAYVNGYQKTVKVYKRVSDIYQQ